MSLGVGESSVWFLIRNLVSLFLSVPSILMFGRFLWIHDQIGNSVYALTSLPLNLIPLLLADVSYVWDLGVLGLIGSAVLLFVNSKLRNIGQRLI